MSTSPVQGSGPTPQQSQQTQPAGGSAPSQSSLQWIHEIMEITNLVASGERPYKRINELIQQLEAQPLSPETPDIKEAIQDLQKAESLLRSQGPSQNVIDLITFAGQKLPPGS